MRRARFAAATLSMVTMLVLAGAGPAAARAAHHPPPAPTDLAVSGYGSSATLSWRQPPGAPVRSFRVYEGTTVVTRSTTTWAGLSNLGFARTRSYTVTAVGPRGLESAHSAVLTRRLGVSGVPPECLPSGLSQLAATRVSPSAVTLTWVNVGDPGVVTVTGGPAGPVSSGLASVRIGGLTPATAYTFSAVRRSACSGPGTPPAAVAVVTPAGPAGHPDAPANPAVSARTDTSLTLSWEPPAGGTPATRYVVYEGGRAVATTGGTSATGRGLY
ncbi:MAG TPA: hypothetical protein VES42_29660, partial [Pilimelia sp.]|nr:hypothetical protein [Pilimelia sp.]